MLSTLSQGLEGIVSQKRFLSRGTSILRPVSYQTLFQRGEQQTQGQLQALPMGMAYVDLEGRAYVHGSDRPEEQIRESYDMFNLVQGYLSSAEGQRLIAFLGKEGKNLKIIGYGSADMGEGPVAAYIHNGREGIIVANNDQGKAFEQRVKEFAGMYHLPEAWMEKYALVHELVHSSGEHTEEGCEAKTAEVFHHEYERASPGSSERQMYQALMRVAEIRAEEARKVGK